VPVAPYCIEIKLKVYYFSPTAFIEYKTASVDYLSMPILDGTSALKMLFGENLRAIRISQKMPQLKLAVKAGVTHNFINDIERGRKGASFGTIAKLAAILGVDVYRFFLPVKDKPYNEEVFAGYPDHVEEFLKAVDDFKRHYIE
jgi:transcriptional regulator with XRE-family HTH domain